MQRKKDFVSVVIPCYNHGAYILETLSSALNQTYSNLEVLIVDDGSDDPYTKDVLDAIDHPQVRILHKENGYVSSARNHGIRHSCGEYILTLDADDQFRSDFLEKAIPVLQHNTEVGVVTSYAHEFDDKGIIRSIHPAGGGFNNFLATNNCLASSLFRYQCWEIAGGYNESYTRTIKGFEDWDFWLSITRKGWNIYCIPEYLMKYRNSPNSMSKDFLNEKPKMMKRLVARHEEVYQKHVIDVIYRKELKIQKLNQVKYSNTYKTGDALLKPLRLIRDLVRETGQPSEKPINSYLNKPLAFNIKKRIKAEIYNIKEGN